MQLSRHSAKILTPLPHILGGIAPTVMPHAMQWRNPEHREFFLSGLRLAAGETA
jgi:hypothetical protein